MVSYEDEKSLRQGISTISKLTNNKTSTIAELYHRAIEFTYRDYAQTMTYKIK